MVSTDPTNSNSSNTQNSTSLKSGIKSCLKNEKFNYLSPLKNMLKSKSKHATTSTTTNINSSSSPPPPPPPDPIRAAAVAVVESTIASLSAQQQLHQPPLNHFHHHHHHHHHHNLHPLSTTTPTAPPIGANVIVAGAEAHDANAASHRELLMQQGSKTGVVKIKQTTRQQKEQMMEAARGGANNLLKCKTMPVAPVVKDNKRRKEKPRDKGKIVESRTSKTFIFIYGKSSPFESYGTKCQYFF